MIVRFKNGNMNCRRDKDCDGGSDVLLTELEDYDCYFLGEVGCIGNFELVVELYSFYTGKKYLLTSLDYERWKEGKTIKLYAENLDKDDKEKLEKEYYSD